MCREKSTCKSSVSVGGSIRICEVVGWLTLTEYMDRMRDAVKATSTHRVHKLRDIFILFLFCIFIYLFYLFIFFFVLLHVC